MLRGFTFTWPIILLILANLAPLFGTLYWGWSVASILVIYWAEGLIIGLLNLPRILSTQAALGKRLFTCVFFMLHYGGFAAVHGVFLSELFDAKTELSSLLVGGALFWTALSFFASHLVSTVVRIGRGEFADKQPNEQMGQPYSRVMIMHMVVLFGAFAVQAMGSPLGALLLLIGIKIIVDLKAHIHEGRMTSQEMAI